MRIVKRVLLTAQLMQSRLIARLLGPHALAVVANADTGLFALDPRDRGVGRQLLLHGRYGDGELEHLKQHVRTAGRVLVVGAHVGALVIPLARLCREIIAVEPNPASNRLLRINLLLNGISNCAVIDAAASDTEGSIEMLLSTANSGGAKRVPVNPDPAYLYDRPQTALVPCAPLDTLIADRNFDLIVMDVEGSEVFALRGMQQILSQSSALAVEFLPHHLKNVAAVSVEQFLAPIAPHFSRLRVPSQPAAVQRGEFRQTLQTLYKSDKGEDSILFTR